MPCSHIPSQEGSQLQQERSIQTTVHHILYLSVTCCTFRACASQRHHSSHYFMKPLLKCCTGYKQTLQMLLTIASTVIVPRSPAVAACPPLIAVCIFVAQVLNTFTCMFTHVHVGHFQHCPCHISLCRRSKANAMSCEAGLYWQHKARMHMILC